MQGGLLAHFLPPLYLRSIVIGRRFSQPHAERALCCRLADFEPQTRRLTALPLPYRIHHPLMLCTALKLDESVIPTGGVEGRHADFSELRCLCWSAGDAMAELIDGVSGAVDLAQVKASQGQPSQGQPSQEVAELIGGVSAGVDLPGKTAWQLDPHLSPLTSHPLPHHDVGVTAGQPSRVSSASQVQSFLTLWQRAHRCGLLPTSLRLLCQAAAGYPQQLPLPTSLPPGTPPTHDALTQGIHEHSYRSIKRWLAEQDYLAARELLLSRTAFREWATAKERMGVPTATPTAPTTTAAAAPTS